MTPTTVTLVRSLPDPKSKGGIHCPRVEDRREARVLKDGGSYLLIELPDSNRPVRFSKKKGCRTDLYWLDASSPRQWKIERRSP